MKLIIITAIKEFEAAVRKELKNASVRNFSFKNVSGYADDSENAKATNWFSPESTMKESVLFFAFVDSENVSKLFDGIHAFNELQKSLSNIRIAVLNVEESNF